MWGQLSNLVGNEALENIKGTVSNLARDLGSLDEDEYEYDDGRNEEMAAQSIEVRYIWRFYTAQPVDGGCIRMNSLSMNRLLCLIVPLILMITKTTPHQLKDYKEEVIRLRKTVAKLKMNQEEQIKKKNQELLARKKEIRALQNAKSPAAAENSGPNAQSLGPGAAESKVSYKEYLDLQRKSQQVTLFTTQGNPATRLSSPSRARLLSLPCSPQVKHTFETRVAKYKKVVMDLKRMVQAERQAKGLNLRKLNELEALHEK
eukprot:1344202-Amorphochlora_amoeboformis.AAC.1